MRQIRGRVVFGLCLFALPLLAADSSAGKAAYRRGDYETAIKELRPLAEGGDAEAQFFLGNIWYGAGGGDADLSEALKWYGMAADQKLPEAEYMLGVIFFFGKGGVPQDAKEAFRWYRAAAEHGLPEAQNHLGAMYYYGEGVPQDLKSALKWYLMAAGQGFAEAQATVGQIYAGGDGVPKDYVQALKWFILAGGPGRRDAREQAERMVQRMTPEQIEEAERLARDWQPDKPRNPKK